MKFAYVAPDLGLTPQLTRKGLAEIAAAGFRSVVNNPKGLQPRLMAIAAKSAADQAPK